MIVSCSTLRIGPYLFYIEKSITQFKTTEKNYRALHSFSKKQWSTTMAIVLLLQYSDDTCLHLHVFTRAKEERMGSKWINVKYVKGHGQQETDAFSRPRLSVISFNCSFISVKTWEISLNCSPVTTLSTLFLFNTTLNVLNNCTYQYGGHFEFLCFK